MQGSSGATTEHIKMCIDFMSGKRINGKKFISKIIGLEDISSMIQEITEGKHMRVIVKP